MSPTNKMAINSQVLNNETVDLDQAKGLFSEAVEVGRDSKHRLNEQILKLNLKPVHRDSHLKGSIKKMKKGMSEVKE